MPRLKNTQLPEEYHTVMRVRRDLDRVRTLIEVCKRRDRVKKNMFVFSVTVFRIRISRDAGVGFQCQKENNGSADHPHHEYFFIARAPRTPLSDAHGILASNVPREIGTTGCRC